jgi:hypothetical protein
MFIEDQPDFGLGIVMGIEPATCSPEPGRQFDGYRKIKLMIVAVFG